MTIQSERCRICEKMVPKEEYKAHFADLHSAFKPYKCKICVTVGYFEPQQLNDHMVTKHVKMIPKNANFNPRNSLKPSIEEKLPKNSQENDGNFNCVICLDSFKTGLLLGAVHIIFKVFYLALNIEIGMELGNFDVQGVSH